MTPTPGETRRDIPFEPPRDRTGRLGDFTLRPPCPAARRAWHWLPALALTACATNEPAPPVPSRPPIEAAGRATVSVGDAESGAAIVLERGQRLVVRLQVAATRGADWSLVEPAPAIVAVESGPRFERALRNTVIDEADGATVWHFRPLAPGTATLAFELRRPQALGPAARSVSFALTVK